MQTNTLSGLQLLSLFPLLACLQLLCPLSLQVHSLLQPLYLQSPLPVVLFLQTFGCLFQFSDQMSSPQRGLCQCFLLPSHPIRLHYFYCLHSTHHHPSHWSIILLRVCALLFSSICCCIPMHGAHSGYFVSIQRDECAL